MSGADAYAVLKVIRDLKGPEFAQTFFEKVAGRRIFIPKHNFQYADGFTVDAFGGMETANEILVALIDFGLCNLNIAMPLGDYSHARQKRLKIEQSLRKGDKSVIEIAHELRVTDRSVYKIRTELIAGGENIISPAAKAVHPAMLRSNEITLEILTSPTLGAEDIERIAANYNRSIRSIRERIRRLRQKNLLKMSNDGGRDA